MKRFWIALTVALFFYAKMDILIWQRIFEANELIDLGLGVYHWGWVHALFGFMILGAMLCYPNLRRMITFPISLAVLAFSGIEDILYYWLDGKALPDRLPWLNAHPLLIKPVTTENLLLSALFWLLVVFAVDLLGEYFEKRFAAARMGKPYPWSSRLKLSPPWLYNRNKSGVELPITPAEPAQEIEGSPS